MTFLRRSTNRNSTFFRRSGRHRKSKYSFLFSLIILGFISYAIYYLFSHSDFWYIKEIELEGLSAGDKLLVYEKLEDKIIGEPFYKSKTSNIEEIFSEDLPGYKLNQVRYTFPSKLNINISERDAEYTVRATNGIFEIDKDGFVLGLSSMANSKFEEIVDVIYDEALKAGENIKNSTLDVALKYSKLDQNVKIVEDEIVIELSEGGKVILPKDTATNKVDQIFTLLQNIIQKYTIENKDVDLIDLRFSKPIIKYKE